MSLQTLWFARAKHGGDSEQFYYSPNAVVSQGTWKKRKQGKTNLGIGTSLFNGDKRIKLMRGDRLVMG